MDKIVGDKELIKKLQGGTKHVEVFDANGKLLGRYIPQSFYEKLLTDFDVLPEVDREIRRKAIEDHRAGRCVTTDQLLAKLEETERAWRKDT